MNVIDRFLKLFPSQKTQETYGSHLRKFFRIIEADPETYFDEERDYKQDIEDFWITQRDDKAYETVRNQLNTLKSFFDYYEVEIKEKTWKTLKRRTKGSGPTTKDRAPTNQQLKEILNYGNLRDRALFLVLSSSGIRIDEALHLLEEDIDFNCHPTKIMVRASIAKNGNSRITFITDETTHVLKQWLRYRKQYLQQAVKKTNIKYRKRLDDPRVFPFSYSTAWQGWQRMIKKAGYDQQDPDTNRFIYRPHGLRKFFDTRLKLELSENVVDDLTGHETRGAITRAYRRHTEQELAEHYLNAQHRLLVFEASPTMEKFDKQVKELRLENTELRRDLDRLIDMMAKETKPWTDDYGLHHGRRYIIDEEQDTVQEIRFSKSAQKFVAVGPVMTQEEFNERQQQEFEEKMMRGPTRESDRP